MEQDPQPLENPLEDSLVTSQEEPQAEADEFQISPELLALRNAVQQIKDEMRLIMVGQDHMIDLMIAAILADGHILIEGVPGLAKTLAAKLLAETLAIKFSRIQFTPDLMPSDVLGTSIFNNQTAAFEFRKGPIFASLILIDEINRAPAKTQSALFEVMEERQVTIDGHTYQMKPPFMVIATQNPIEQEGTYRLPEAQLDRFLFKIEVDYPSMEEEIRILSEFHDRKSVNDLEAISPVMDALEVAKYQALVRSVHIDEHLISYIVKLVNHTRNNKDLFLGASPRASLNIMATAKALAAMRGRNFVTPEDIQFMAPPVLQHRIILTPEKEMEGATPAAIVRRLVESYEVPR